jgi:hypothetical protein
MSCRFHQQPRRCGHRRRRPGPAFRRGGPAGRLGVSGGEARSKRRGAVLARPGHHDGRSSPEERNLPRRHHRQPPTRRVPLRKRRIPGCRRRQPQRHLCKRRTDNLGCAGERRRAADRQVSTGVPDWRHNRRCADLNRARISERTPACHAAALHPAPATSPAVGPTERGTDSFCRIRSDAAMLSWTTSRRCQVVSDIRGPWRPELIDTVHVEPSPYCKHKADRTAVVPAWSKQVVVRHLPAGCCRGLVRDKRSGVSAERLRRLWRASPPRLGNRQPLPSYCQAPTIRHSDEYPCASRSFVSTSAAA